MAGSAEDKFFEFIAKSGYASAAEEPAEEQEPVAEAETEPEAELARASTVSRELKVAPRKQDRDDALLPEGQLTIDVYQTENDIVVESAVAGVRPEDIDIDVTNDSVSIRGSRHHEKEVNDEDYYYQECFWGRFSRSVILPQEIDPESASVSFKNGILTVRLPKLNRKKAKKLRVRTD